MSELPRSWEFGHHTPTAHQRFCTGSLLNGLIQDAGLSPYLWDCISHHSISQELGLTGAPSNMADRMLCTIQHGGQNIFCHDPKINQYRGLNLFRETYIKGALSYSEVNPTKILSCSHSPTEDFTRTTSYPPGRTSEDRAIQQTL